MQIPIEISFRDMPHADDAEAEVRERAAELEKFYDRITSCRVVLEMQTHKGQRGRTFHARVDLTVPGREIVVNRERATGHEDATLAIRDAFKAARRQLQDYVRERRGRVKQHETPPHGRVAKLFSDYGFIATPEGKEVYFHANAVLEARFDELTVGEEVRFVEEQGEKGPQATSVRSVGRHHHL